MRVARDRLEDLRQELGHRLPDPARAPSAGRADPRGPRKARTDGHERGADVTRSTRSLASPAARRGPSTRTPSRTNPRSHRSDSTTSRSSSHCDENEGWFAMVSEWMDLDALQGKRETESTASRLRPVRVRPFALYVGREDLLDLRSVLGRDQVDDARAPAEEPRADPEQLASIIEPHT